MANEILKVDEVQHIELEMLDFFQSVCKENQIDYCLAYGSALGAHRHGGFIPWDDDMDVYIKRKDCAKLFDLLDKSGKGRYKVFRPCETEGYNHPYAKLVDCATQIEEPKNVQVDGLGIFIDLFPCDFYISSSRFMRIRIALINIMNKVYCQMYVRSHQKDSPLIRGFWRLIAKMIPSGTAHIFIERLIEWRSAPDGPYISCPYDADYLIPSSYIFPTKSARFEAMDCCIPGHIDLYLSAMYGPDYMTPQKTKSAFHGVARSLNDLEYNRSMSVE